MSVLNQLWAPDVLPDTQSDEYQAVLRILEDHPVTAGMDHSARASLAQRCVDAVTEVTQVEALDQMVDEAYDGFAELLHHPKLNASMRDSIPSWARARFVTSTVARAATLLDKYKPEWSAGLDATNEYALAASLPDFLLSVGTDGLGVDIRVAVTAATRAASGDDEALAAQRAAWGRAVGARKGGAA